jgi:hypothetical protein
MSRAPVIGVAYSIARDSLATDNINVVQSRPLAKLNSDANRVFLNVQRVDVAQPSAARLFSTTSQATHAIARARGIEPLHSKVRT